MANACFINDDNMSDSPRTEPQPNGAPPLRPMIPFAPMKSKQFHLHGLYLDDVKNHLVF